MEMGKLEGTIYGYNKKTLASVAALVVVAGIAFYGGAKYEKNKLVKMGLTKNANDVCFNSKSQAIETVAGEVASVGDNSVTIKKADGSTLEASIATTTKIGAKGDTLASFAVGQQVTVKGIDSADGKFLTQSIKKVVAAIQPAQSK